MIYGSLFQFLDTKPFEKNFNIIFCLSVLKDSLQFPICESMIFQNRKVFWVPLFMNVSIKLEVEATPKLFNGYA